jgi:hypothetical protein
MSTQKDQSEKDMIGSLLDGKYDIESVDDSDRSPPTINSNKSISFRSLKLKTKEMMLSVRQFD